jgi:hypothetical protein
MHSTLNYALYIHLAIRYLFPKPVVFIDCEFPLVTSTCRHGNYLA